MNEMEGLIMTGALTVLMIGCYYWIHRSALTGVAPDKSEPLLAKIIGQKAGYPGWYECEVIWPIKLLGLGVTLRSRFCSVDHVVGEAAIMEVVETCRRHLANFGRVDQVAVDSHYLAMVGSGPALIRVVYSPKPTPGVTLPPSTVYCNVVWIGGKARGENACQNGLTCSLSDLTRKVLPEEVEEIKLKLGVVTDF